MSSARSLAESNAQSSGSTLATRSFNSLPGLNFTTARAGIGTAESGLVRIASDLRLRLGDLEGPEVAEDDIVIGRQTGGDFLNEALHDTEDFLLGQTRLVADPDDKIPVW